MGTLNFLIVIDDSDDFVRVFGSNFQHVLAGFVTLPVHVQLPLLSAYSMLNPEGVGTEIVLHSNEVDLPSLSVLEAQLRGGTLDESHNTSGGVYE